MPSRAGKQLDPKYVLKGDNGKEALTPRKGEEIREQKLAD